MVIQGFHGLRGWLDVAGWLGCWVGGWVGRGGLENIKENVFEKKHDIN